jgi:putative MATE family efflux protein
VGSISTPRLLSVSTTQAMGTIVGPSICIGLLRTAYGLADQYWVGMLGSVETIALGGCSYATWIILVMCELGEFGVQAISAFEEGAGRRERVARVVAQGFWVSIFVAVLLALSAPMASLYFDVLGFDPMSPEYAAGLSYLFASVVGALPLALSGVMTAGLRGLGLFTPALVITASTVLINTVLDPILIWGLGPFPALGVAGAAWGTTLSTVVGCVLSMRALKAEGVEIRLVQPVLSAIRRIINVGSPMCISGLLFSFVYLFIGRIANDLGAANVAALGLSHRLEAVAYVICEGFGVGAATLVGQWLGSQRPDAARRAANSAAIACACVMLPVGLLAGVFAEPLLSLFTSDATILSSATRYLQINAAVFTLMGCEVVYDGAFAGSENTRAVLWVGATLNLLRLPAAYVLSLSMGIDGVWVAIALTTAVKAVYKALCFFRQPLRGERERFRWQWVPTPWELTKS